MFPGIGMPFLPELIGEELNHLLFDVDIEGEFADKGKEAEKLPVFFGGVREDLLRRAEFLKHILLEDFALFLLQGEQLPVEFRESRLCAGGKVLFADGGKQFLDLAERDHILVIVDENQHQDVVAGIFLFHRGRQEPVFGVVVDHGFGDNHFIRIVAGARNALIHEGGYLVHIEIDVRNIFRLDMGETVHIGHQVLQSFFVGLFQYFHPCCVIG